MNTKIRCILLDDELPSLTYLKLLCEQIDDLEIVKAFNNPESLLKDLPGLEFDLCILDIEMPGVNGLQIANLLNGKPVIFSTAYKEYAAEAFDLNAIDYVRKPIKKERLQQAIIKAQNLIETHKVQKSYIQLNTDKGKALLFFEQIQYVTVSEVDSRDKVAFMEDGTAITIKNFSFEKLLKLLPSDLFCQVNKKDVISLKIVTLFSHSDITTRLLLSNGRAQTFNLSESFKDEFFKRLKK